ncbi:MAG: Trk system potassium transporter TrkA [Clostridia bacterium]|nr:Trk system potassium transporter TrkA [Clostridia bacterium]
MKIVIIGCDRVGTAVLELLSKDDSKHEITVIDINQAKVDNATRRFDINGFTGDGVLFEVQKNAGVANSDVVICCADSDEVNILCSMVAKELKAKHTVILNSKDTYSREIGSFLDRYNIDMAVCPNKLEAEEVARMIKYPAALQVQTYAEGRLELIDITIDEGSKFVGYTIAEKHGKMYPEIQICAVEREGETIIPTGDFLIKAGDKLSIASTQAGIIKYLKNEKEEHYSIKKLVILGGGKNTEFFIDSLTSFSLSKLKQKGVNPLGIRMTVIEKDLERCNELADMYPKLIVINGESNDYELMKREGNIESSDAFIAFTDNNEKNIIASLYALNKGVKKVITSVDDYSLFSVIGEIEIGSVVSPNILTATEILKYVKGLEDVVDIGSKLNSIHRLGNNGAYVLEMQVNESFKYKNIPLKDLYIQSETLIALIIRGDLTIIPRGNDIIMDGDKVIVVTKCDGIDGINEVFK